MSRALGKDVKETLKKGDHAKVFAEISRALTAPSDELLELELLGKEHVLDELTFLQDDTAIAIPKIRLVQAFIVARKIFISYTTEHFIGLVDDVLGATAVMLLMDPEHLTAANTRKRLLSKTLANNRGNERWLKLEKHFVDSVLTSRLHRHTKSPNLWNHRRWLMDQFKAQGVDVDVGDDLKRVIMVSGERHPRNYYAWCHARYLVQTFVSNSSYSDEVMSRIISDTKNWAFTHNDDISGWQFLRYLLDKQRQEASAVVLETLRYAESFKWKNESVWYFLRYIVAVTDEAQVREEFLRVKEILWKSSQEGSRERKTLEQATIVQE